MLKTKDLYDLSHTAAGAYLSGFEYPWQALAGIKELIVTLGQSLREDYIQVSPQVWVHKTAVVAPTAYWAPPAISVPTRRCGTVLLYPGLRSGGRKLRGGQLRGTEKT